MIHRINSSKVAQSSLIVDKESDSDDDFVVKEQKLQDDQKPLNGYGADGADDEDFNNDGLKQTQHGALVKKILESKEQLENGSTLNKKTESVSLRFIIYAKKEENLLF